MDYIELSVAVAPRFPAADVLITELSERGFESFVDTDEGFLAYIPQRDYSPAVLEPLTAANPALGTVTWHEKLIPGQNWNAAWEASFLPVDIAGACQIRAPFHPPAPEGWLELIIQPQMSFGTGHHPTTFLMTEKLLTLPLAGKSVMDMGSGTGVLAILAARRGAAPVDAVDVEAQAVENARENVAHNAGVQVSVYEGDDRLLEGKTYDVLIANINRNVLLAAMPAYAAALPVGGTLLLSGFFTADVPVLTECAAACGLQHTETRSLNEWALLELTRI